MLKEELLKKYCHRIELHAHSSPASGCCDCPNDRFIEAYAEKGVEAICLTNHFYKDNGIFINRSKSQCIEAYLEDYEKIQELAVPYGIKIYLGCEIRFSQNCNDYLIYGLNREILEEAFDYLTADIECFRHNVKLDKSVFIQAHPFRNNITLADPNLLDGIETLNFHNSHNSRNAASALYAKENNKSICIGGSDFHSDNKYNSASCVMLSKTLPEDSFELAELIKSGDYLFLLGDNHIIIT